MQTLRLSGKKVMAVVALVVSLLFSVALPAEAANTIVWNSRGSSVPMYYAPTSATYVKAWLPNSSRFTMLCWVDHQSYYGNYSTNRWFWGQTFAGGHYGYVNASWVYYQKSVPRC